MPILHLDLDYTDRPILDLSVSMSSFDCVTQPDHAVFLPRTVRALVDTGAGRSHVALEVLQSLNIEEVGKLSVNTASTGDQPVRLGEYYVDLGMPGEQPGPFVFNLKVVGSDRLQGLRVEMLLGRDVLDRCLLIYDGTNRRFSIAYNPPTQPLS